VELALTEPVGSGLVAITIVVALVIMVTPRSVVSVDNSLWCVDIQINAVILYLLLIRISFSSSPARQVTLQKGLFLKDAMFYMTGVMGVLVLLLYGSANRAQVSLLVDQWFRPADSFK